MSKTIAVIVVAPRVLQREGIASLLQNTHYKVVAAISDADELANVSFPNASRTLALVARDQQNANSDQTSDIIGRLRVLIPEGKVVLLLETNSAIDLQRVLPLSPDACLVNVASRDVLLKTLDLTLMRRRVFVFGDSPTSQVEEISGHASAFSPRSSHRLSHELSPRECQVLTWLAQGQSNKAIARLGNLSEATVKVHLKAILRKTNTQNRTQAAIWAINNGFGNASLERNRLIAADAPALSPAGKMESTEYHAKAGVGAAASPDGRPSAAQPSARHPDLTDHMANKTR